MGWGWGGGLGVGGDLGTSTKAWLDEKRWMLKEGRTTDCGGHTVSSKLGKKMKPGIPHHLVQLRTLRLSDFWKARD